MANFEKIKTILVNGLYFLYAVLAGLFEGKR